MFTAILRQLLFTSIITFLQTWLAVFSS